MSSDDLDGLMAKLAATPAQLTQADLTGARQRFEIKRRVGSGSFGDVYEARERESGNIVALKALKSSKPEWLYRFKREFRTVADLSHPNVIRLYELFSVQDQWYLTMELIDGIAFDEHLTRAPEQFLSCFRQLALAIEALHDAECVHCDIKPSNALVERTGRVVLLDFGLARPQKVVHRTAVAGTPHYMAPERGMGDPPTEAGDWYAFGVILYEALTGRPVFQGTDHELMSLKLSGPPPCVPDARPETNAALCELATRLLSPSSSERPQGEEVIAVLSFRGSQQHMAMVRHDEEVLVGREAELDALEAALARSTDRAVVATVAGPPGIGKSTVVAAFGDRARAAGASVYEGRCHEAEAVPYKGIDGAVDMLCSDLRSRRDLGGVSIAPDAARALAVMFPVLRRVEAFSASRGAVPGDQTPRELRRMACRGLRELLSGLASDQRLVFFVDDMQWATDDGAQLLLDLLAPPAPPILLVLAYHSDAVGRSSSLDLLLDGVAAAGLERVELAVEPLGSADVAALVEQRGVAEAEVARIVSETGGDPFLIARGLDAESGGESFAADLATAFRGQLDALAPLERQLLELIAVSAIPLTQAAACVASGVRRWTPITFDRLRREKLIRSLGQSRDGLVETYHERVREVTLANMSEDHRRVVHLRLAGYLEAHARVDPAVLAHHYRHGGARNKARRWTLQAARSATQALAFARAVELYRTAVELSDSPGERIESLVELADAREQAGRRADAGRACLQAADWAASTDSRWAPSALRARGGEHLMLSGHFADGMGLVRDALADVSVVLPESAATAIAETINLTALLATRGIDFTERDEVDVAPAHLRRVDLALATARALVFTDVRAPWISARALVDALDAGEPMRVQRALCHFAFANVARAPDHEIVSEAIERAQELATRRRDDAGLAFVSLARGMQHVQRMEHREGIEHLRDAAVRFSTCGQKMARETAIARVLVGLVCGNYGVDIKRAQTVRERCIADAIEREDRFILNWVRLLGSWLDLSFGDADAAARNLAAAREAWPNVQDDLFVATSLMHEISIELYARPETAWETIREAERRFHSLFTSLVPVPRAMFYRHWGFAAVLAFQQGKAERGETLVRVRQCASVIESLPYVSSLQAVIRAHLAAVSGDRRAAADELGYAARGWGEGGQRGPALLTELRRYQLLGRTRDVEGSMRQLREFGVGDPDCFARLFVGPRFDRTVTASNRG